MQPNVETLISRWYDRAQLDYDDLYMRLYVSYNAWYRQVTGCATDREAINALKKRFVIWDDYQRGRVLISLRPVLHDIVNLTGVDKSLKIKLADEDDWQNLIEFWYQVRCHLFHGSGLFATVQQAIWTRLAYQSLNLFMGEVVARMGRTFTNADYQRLKEIDILLQHEPAPSKRLKNMQQVLYQKYIHSPDIWNVDMVRA
jgi:hypothetical protein